MIHSIIKKLLVVVTVCAFMSCSGSDSDSSSGGTGGNNRLRFLNTIPELPIVFLYLDDSTVPIELLYGVPTEYENYEDDKVEVRVLVASSPLALLDQEFNLSSSDTEFENTSEPDKTLVFFGDTDPDPTKPYNISTKLLKDIHIPEVDNRFNVRVINAIPGSKSFDVYVTDPNVPLDAVLPFIRGINFKGNERYSEGNETSATVIFADSKTQEVFYVSNLIDFVTNPVITFYALSLADGGNVLVSRDSDF